MRIAWFTPFDQHSAIGKVSIQICERLFELNHQIDIWAYETKSVLNTILNVVNYDPANLDISALDSYDYVIYNMGNFAGFHWAIYEAMMQYPGILILHDRTFFLFFSQYCDVQYGVGSKESKKQFLQLIRDEYGTIGETAIEEYPSSDVMVMNEFIAKFSFLRKICENVKGVFTHSKSFAEAIRECSPTLVSYAYLPCEKHVKDIEDLPGFFVRDPKKLLVVSTGIVHPVKHIREMVDVMSVDPFVREHVQYVLIGECGGPYGDELKRFAVTELKDSFYVLGYQPDNVMYSFLNEADLCLNLRYPNSEACSLSLFEQMAYGKAVIVYDSGVFSEMPQGTVYKIKVDDAEKQLAKALHKMIENKELRETIGTNALKFIQDSCSLDEYCKRFLDFLVMVNNNKHYGFYQRVLTDIHQEMLYLGFNKQDVPDVMDDIVSHTATILNAEKTKIGRRDVIAIWAALPYRFSGLHREGVMKLYSRLVEALIETTTLYFEVWTYEVHFDEILMSFQKVLDKWPERIKIITENNWKDQLFIPSLDRNLPWSVSIEEDNLGMIAGQYSEACVFAPIILYLDNVLQTHRPVYVPAMDMSIKYYYEEFVYRDPTRKFHARDIEGKVDRMFRSGMGGYCMSRTIKDEQILPLLRNAKEDDIEVVWTPDMTSVSENDFKYSDTILNYYRVCRPYIFYPTQFRPNKNIETLMKAFDILIKVNPELKLVFTGHLEELPDLQKEWKRRKSYSSLIFIHDLSEEELFNIYHFASCVPVTTIMEGGFPAQAIEAMKMDIPVVIARNQVVEERLKGCNMTKENCGLALFDPYDEKELAGLIQEALISPNELLIRQRKFWNTFSQYTWKEAAEKHYQLLMKAAGI